MKKEPLTKLVEDGQLAGYIHKGFWQCMDTLREKQKLEKLWEDGNAPWKLWKDCRKINMNFDLDFYKGKKVFVARTYRF